MSGDRFNVVKTAGITMSEIFHLTLLFVAGFAVLWAAVTEIIYFIDQGGPKLKDILLLFIYIELGAMIAIYFKTNRLSVRFLIYVAITALTRLLVIDIKAMSNETILTITGAIVLLTVSIFVLRVANSRFGGDLEESD